MTALLPILLPLAAVALPLFLVLQRRAEAVAAGMVAAALVAVLMLMLRQPMPFLAALAVAGLGLRRQAHLRRRHRRRGRHRSDRRHDRPRRSRSATTVRTDVLEMSLERQSGGITGRVLSGVHAGRALDTLTLPELLEIAAGLDEGDAQSARLLATYLDRMHPGWSDAAENGGPDASAEPASGTMTPEQALALLGLSAGASRAEIEQAHRRLIKRVHPDAGGSAALAAQINAARARLL